MKSFNYQAMKKMGKKEMEEQKRKDDEVAAAHAFEEYMTTFQGSNKPSSKVWIKAGTYEAGKKEDTKDKGTIYKPTSRFEVTPKFEPVYEEQRPPKKKEKEKKKSNLEIFKEELKIIQEEREERHRLKTMLGLHEVIKLPPKPGDDLRASLSLELDDVKMGSMDDGDPNTTNIYLGNLPTKISEQQLMEIFGQFGPLASVKVMWPRTEEEKSRNRLSGFVAFMARRDGERALRHLSGSKVLGPDIKIGWGKVVPIPSFPIYIPPPMLTLTMPPPLSGLPFNSQPHKRDRDRIPPAGTPYPTDSRGKEEFERVLYSATVKVVVPTDRSLLALIHRMVEFVTREGPMFEAMIMNREINNPQYRFLFENQSPAHIYYRWKLFSILQGEPTQRWRTEEFRMFKDGSIWKPPNVNLFTAGMPNELIPEEEREIRKGSLSNAQRDRLEKMLRSITCERHRIAEVMIFCIEHAESADEICQCLKESFLNPKTELPRKVARLYIISDILSNCTLKGMDAIIYRKTFKTHLPTIFQEVHYAHETGCAAKNNETNESFKQRVMAVFRAWEEWGIYPNEFLIRLQNIFLGLLTVNSKEEEAKILEGIENDNDEEIIKKRRKSPPRAMMPPKSALNFVRSLQSTSDHEHHNKNDNTIDGVPLEDSEIDGIPMEMDTQQLYQDEYGTTSRYDNNERQDSSQSKKGGFKPATKWETIDPEQVKAQAVTTTSKWDLFEENSTDSKENSSNNTNQNQNNLVNYDEDIDGVPLEDDDIISDEEGILQQESSKETNYLYGFDEEERRLKLREIEVKVVAFQDEIECGRRPVKHGFTMSEMVQNYRESLLKKADKEKSENSSITSYDDDYRDKRSSGKSSHRKNKDRSRSSSRNRSNRDRDRDKDRERDRDRDRDRDKDRERDRERSNRDRSRSPLTPRSTQSSSNKYNSNRHNSRSPVRNPSRSKHRSRSKSPYNNMSGSSSSRRSKRYSKSRSRSRSPAGSSRHRQKHKR